VPIFADTTGYGEAGLKDVEAALASKNLKATHVARCPLGVKVLKESLAAARAAGANVVFSYTVGQENAVIANGCVFRSLLDTHFGFSWTAGTAGDGHPVRHSWTRTMCCQ
jgi:hypothetical protein